MKADRHTVEIRYRPCGTEDTFQLWLAVGALSDRPTMELACVMRDRLAEHHPAFQFAVFVKGQRV